MKEKRYSVTRGNGILEGYLSRQRAQKADGLILSDMRKGRILDIGCGKEPYFLQNVEFHEKYGVDPQVKRSSRCKGIHIVKSNRLFLPFPDDFFDVVVMLAVIEHLSLDAVAVQVSEVHRVLRKGGRFIITTPAKWTSGLLSVLSSAGLVSREEIDEHKKQYSQTELHSVLRHGGFHGQNIRTGSFELFMNTWAFADK